MLFRPRLVDYKIISFYTGKLIMGIGLLMLIPMAISLASQEWSPVLDFLIGASITIIAGLLTSIFCRTGKEMRWMHGILVVPIAWLAAMLFGAIPHYLGGHFATFFDAMFDTMSGFTTTGLTLIRDLDHLSYGHNFWRHLTIFIGGQGIVIVMLTLMAGGASSIYALSVGEAREEKILPNLMHTARFIRHVSLVYFVVASGVLWRVCVQLGIIPLRALFHAPNIFMAAFDTGGFTPQSQSIVYYHSPLMEFWTLPLMLAGAINFALYYALFSGNKREIFKNGESITMTLTIFAAFSITAIALAQAGVFNEVAPMFRRGFYQMISAYTSTGFTTVQSHHIPDIWGPLGVLTLVVAMGLGASIGSTAGGIKAHRLMVIVKAFVQEIKKMVLPPSAITVVKYHHLKKNPLTEKLVLNAFLVGMAYIASYIIGALMGALMGYSLHDALFQSVSAGANIGISSRIPLLDAPDILKATYVFQMWAGRLEFVSVLALLGFLVSAVRGK
ncbi:MAG: potassium transporter TrkG [Actinomycetota bacterium]|nr:potassium transporter TrkG [Actinomycetota bacterium]